MKAYVTVHVEVAIGTSREDATVYGCTQHVLTLLDSVDPAVVKDIARRLVLDASTTLQRADSGEANPG